MRRLLLFLLPSFTLASAHTITHGPVVGGVFPISAKIYYLTDVPSRITVECSADSLFQNPSKFSDSTTSIDNSVIITLNHLDPGTRYYYRAFSNGQIQAGRSGTFKTFPPEGQKGYYKIVAGSCNYNPGCGGGHGNPNWKNDVLFKSIVDFDPNIVMHLGDWGYPPSCLGAYYNTNPYLAAQSFQIRYTDENMTRHILPNLPIDYTYDDDYTQNGNAGWTFPVVRTQLLTNGETKYVLEDLPLEAGTQKGAIAAYFRHFPGYEQVDSSAIHHTFKMGNVEFFVLDTRGAKSPVHEPFKYNSLTNTYEFLPSNSHSTLGPLQKQWLLDKLQQSTADWKVIVSGVLFNKRNVELMNLVMLGQLLDRSYVKRAADLAYMWAGYPKDINDLMAAIRNNNIKNVLMLSGDTHSSMMDDGRNSGIPEISASGWSSGNEGYLNAALDSVIRKYVPFTSVKDFLWNGGGNGVGNSNYNDSYAQMEFFGSDSMRACIVDEFNQKIACMTIKSKIVLTDAPSTIYAPEEIFTLFYPNPTREILNIEMSSDVVKAKQLNYYISDVTGRIILNKEFLQTDNPRKLNVNLSALNKGFYIFTLEKDGELFTRKFFKD